MGNLKRFINDYLAGVSQPVPAADFHKLTYIYYALTRREKPCVDSASVRNVLESCGIGTIPYNAKWRVR